MQIDNIFIQLQLSIVVRRIKEYRNAKCRFMVKKNIFEQKKTEENSEIIR